MGGIFDAAIVGLGTWLLLYRILFKTRLRAVAEVLTAVACGLSSALTSLLLPWPPAPEKVVLLAIVGILFSICHPMFMALVVAANFGACFSCLAWHLGVCSLLPEGEAPLEHGALVLLTSFIFIGVFVFTPGLAGPNTLQTLLIPMLGAILLATGISGLASGSYEFGLPPAKLMGASCEIADDVYGPALQCLSAWLAISALGVALQILMSINRERPKEQEEEANGSLGGSLVASLLPARAGGSGPEKMPREGDAERHRLLLDAIFAPPEADLSHLTDHERRLVDICRKDEFERERVLWGGGLI